MSLFAKELRDLRYRLIVLGVLILAMGIFILGSYEIFINSVDINQFTAAVNNSTISKYMDPELLTQQIMEIINNIDLYVWSQWFGKNFMQLMLLSSIVIGFSAFARETEHSTFSFLLTNFKRSQVFLTKVGAGILSMTILVALGCLLPAVLAAFKSFDFSLILSFKYFMQILPAALLCYAIIIFFSVLNKDVVKPIIYGVITFTLLSVLKQIKYFNGIYFYRYLAAADVFTNGQINLLAFLIVSIIALLTFFAAYKIYQEKNF
ncbi:MAG: hypothetical protein GX790_04460 [Syntrophomonadaceae bacterium]|nr:hypothetical protein [Syntrophomonadaceae bacterium]